MNDGPAPQKRSAFSVILPYILMIATVGLFIWLIVSSSVGKPVEWARSQIDDNVGYSLVLDEETGQLEGELNHEAAEYRVYAVEVTQGYKAVSVTGGYIDANNRFGTFTVRIEEEVWSGDGFGFKYIDADGNEGDHAYYSAIFQSCVAYAEAHPIQGVNAYYRVLDGFEVSWWDSWGPTIVMLVITVLLAFWILSRLNKSVSGMNNSAFSFNKSPARKANSKVRFTDVAGCDEEKAEMVELVEYLVGKLASEGSWSVELLENGEESDIVVRVSGKDIGKVIGKQGKIAKALRTLVRAATPRDSKKYNVEIKERSAE